MGSGNSSDRSAKSNTRQGTQSTKAGMKRGDAGVTGDAGCGGIDWSQNPADLEKSCGGWREHERPDMLGGARKSSLQQGHPTAIKSSWELVKRQFTVGQLPTCEEHTPPNDRDEEYGRFRDEFEGPIQVEQREYVLQPMAPP